MIFATRITGKKFTATDLTLNVESGKPIRVYSIEFYNNSLATKLFTISEADGTHIIAIPVATKAYAEWSVPFLADKGLKIVCSIGGDATVTVLHTNPGT